MSKNTPANDKPKKLSNILNHREGADRNIDFRIRFYVVALAGFTIFYLNAGLSVVSNGSVQFSILPGIGFTGLSQEEFLCSLFVLNSIALFRLYWRVFISYGYNVNYIRAYGNEQNEEDRAYQNNSKHLKIIEKYAVGLCIPFAASAAAILWLISHIYERHGLLIVIFIITFFFIHFCFCLYKNEELNSPTSKEDNKEPIMKRKEYFPVLRKMNDRELYDYMESIIKDTRPTSKEGIFDAIQYSAASNEMYTRSMRRLTFVAIGISGASFITAIIGIFYS